MLNTFPFGQAKEMSPTYRKFSHKDLWFLEGNAKKVWIQGKEGQTRVSLKNTIRLLQRGLRGFSRGFQDISGPFAWRLDGGPRLLTKDVFSSFLWIMDKPTQNALQKGKLLCRISLTDGYCEDRVFCCVQYSSKLSFSLLNYLNLHCTFMWPSLLTSFNALDR